MSSKKKLVLLFENDDYRIVHDVDERVVEVEARIRHAMGEQGWMGLFSVDLGEHVSDPVLIVDEVHSNVLYVPDELLGYLLVALLELAE